MNQKNRTLNMPLMAIIAEGFSSRLSFGLISFVLPLYAHHLGLSLTAIGLLASLNTIVAIILKPLTGWAADRFGLKRTFMIAIGIRSLVALFNSFAILPWQLYSIRTAHGLATSLRDPASNALLAEHGGEKKVASAFAWYQTAKSVAGSLGKALAGLLLALTAANYSLVFFTAFILSVLPLLVVALFVKEVDYVKSTTPVVTKPSHAEPVKNPRTSWKAIAPYMSFGFLISCTAEMMTSLFPILATEYGKLTEAQTGLIFSISTIVVLFAGPFFGWLADNVSNKLVLMIRGISNLLSSLAFLFFPSFIGIGIGKIADDSGKAAFRPAWGSLMAHVSSLDKKRRAQTMNWMTMGEDAGDIVGPILAGFLWSTWGIAFALGARALLAVITEIYAITLAGSLVKPQDTDVSILPPTVKIVNEKFLTKIKIMNDSSNQA